MNAPEPVLTSSRIRSVATASFFDITLAAINGIDGTVAVASRSAYKRAVGRHQVGRLRGDGAPHLVHLRLDLRRGQVGSQARDRFQLVEGAAGVAESSPGELRDRQAHGGRERSEDQRHAVSDPSGRMLVHGGQL